MAPSRIIFPLCLIFLALTIHAVAQDDSKRKAKFKLPLDRPLAIKFNAQVVDARGNHIGDATLSQLKVFEDDVEQKITYFARKEPVLNVVFLMDNTGSMRLQFKKVQAAAKGVIDVLNDNDEVVVIRFVNSDKIEIVEGWTSEKAKLKGALDDLYIEGGQSAVIDALYLSAQKLLELEKAYPSQRYVVILFSDVEDRDSYYRLEDLLKLFKGSDTQVFVAGTTVELPTKKFKSIIKTTHPKENAENLAQIIALETGGTARLLSTAYSQEDLTKVAESIIDELRYPYVIGYTSTNKNRDGKARRLRVEVADGEKGEKRYGYVRESFVVPKE